MRWCQRVEGELGDLVWSADSRWLAEARLGPVIVVRDAATGAVVYSIDESASRRKPCHASLAFAVDGTLYAHVDRQVLRWRDGRRERLFGYTGRARPDCRGRLHLSVDGGVLLTADGEGMDLRRGVRLLAPEPPAWVVDDIRLSAVALAPDGQTCVVAWDVTDRRQHTMALTRVRPATGACDAWLTQGELPPCEALWFDPGGAWVMAIGERSTDGRCRVSVFGTSPGASGGFGALAGTSTMLAMLADPSDAGRGIASRPVTCVALAPDGQRLFCAAGRQMSVVTPAALRHPKEVSPQGGVLPIDEVTRLAVSPDGQAMAVGNAHGEVGLVALAS